LPSIVVHAWKRFVKAVRIPDRIPVAILGD
jgi:hypothetical protein